MTNYFFTDPEIDLEMITSNKFLKKFSEEELSTMLQQTVQKVKDIAWNEESLQSALNELLVETAKKPAELFSIIRLALSYAPFSPALHLTMNVLGHDATLARLQETISALEND